MQPITIKSFNAHALNDASYSATLMNASALPAATNAWVQNMQADAADSLGFTVGLRTPLLYISILNYGSRHALGEQLKAWMKRGTRGELAATFSDDGLDYLLNCAVVNIVQTQGDATRFVCQLESADTNWRAVTADTDSWVVTGTGGTKDITVLGGDDTRLSAVLVSTTGGTVGYDYQNIYRLPGVAGIDYGTRHWCLTIDSAALVTAGKLLATMFDYRIVINGKEVPRWIVNPNTAVTNIWFNAPIGRGESLTLQTAIAATGNITLMQFAISVANKLAIRRMPNSGMVYHGTEWIQYTGKDEVNCRLKTPQRGIYGTAKQAHVTGSAFIFLPATIIAKYGNAIATDPALDDPNYDDNKPTFDLANSDNTKAVYSASYKFYDDTRPSAPGSWSPVLTRLGDVSDTYSVKENAETGDAAIGGLLGSYLKNGAWETEVGKAGFSLYCAGGFSEITLVLRKYANAAARFPAKAGCQRSADGAVFYSVFNEAIPVLSTWTTVTHTAVAVATTSKYLFVGLEGTITKLAGALAMLEGLTATVKYNSANLPTGVFLGETGNFTLDLTLTSAPTGDALYLDYPMALNTEFELDGEAFTVTNDGVNMSDAMRLDDEGRGIWIGLRPGTNTLTLTSPDAGTLTIALRWYRRRL